MSETLELLDALGRKTGQVKDRNQAHIDGDWHSSAHVWFIDNQNRILLQKRALTKKLYPGMWVAPVSGHISENSSAVETAIIETHEELNISLTENDFFLLATLRGTFDDPKIGLKEREYINIFIVNKEFEINLNIHNDEVDGFKWFTYEEFKKMVDEMDANLVPAFEEYEAIIAHIKYNKNLNNRQ